MVTEDRFVLMVSFEVLRLIWLTREQRNVASLLSLNEITYFQVLEEPWADLNMLRNNSFCLIPGSRNTQLFYNILEMI